jgi:tRNA threonylcarbamoyladenosine dehydratase
MVDERLQRTVGVLSEESLAKLAATHVVVAGVGGTGGQCAVDLARLGVGFLTLADFDVYERHNINRQIGAFESTLGRPKVEVVAGLCSDVNPRLRVRRVNEGVTETTVDRLVHPPEFPKAQFVVEVVDVQGVAAKAALHAMCRNQDVVLLTAPMIGFGAALHVFHPDAPPFEQALLGPDGRLDLGRIAPRVGSYFVPEVLAACLGGQGHVPTCGIGATLASALVVSEIVRGVVFGRGEMVAFPECVYLDLLDGVFLRGRLPEKARP